MNAKLLLMTVVLLIVVVLTGCRFSDNNLEGGDSTAAADPEKLYRQNCITCHGTGLDRQTNLNTVGSRMTVEEIAHKIRRGGGGMIPFEGRLTANQIDAIAVWLAAKK